MIRLPVKVVPGASRDRVVGWLGGRLKVTVTAPPEGGRANRALVETLRRLLGLPRSAFRVLTGEARPEKILEVDAPEADVLSKLPPR